MRAAGRIIRSGHTVAIRADDRVADRKTDAETLLRGEEIIEVAIEVFLANPRSAVTDRKTSHAVGLHIRVEPNPAERSALLNRLEIIDEQIDDDLLELNTVPDPV
jgi:hypothetical protein